MQTVIKNINPILRFPSTEPWITVLLFICILVLAWVKTAFPKKIPIVFRDVFTATLPENEGITPSSVALFFVFICSGVLLTMQLLKMHGLSLYNNAAKEFLTLALMLFLFYIGKTLAILFSGFIFDQQQSAMEYLTEVYVFSHLLGLVLLPVSVLVTYAPIVSKPVVLEGIFIAIGLLFIYRGIKMFILMTNKGLSMIYLFLYICALEIMPFALFLKYAKMSLNI